MGTTFLSIKRNGFWMNDGVLELFLRLASLHIEDTVESDSIEHRIRNEWLLASRGHFNGAVPIRLDGNVSTDVGKKAVLDAINSLLKSLNQAPRTLDAGVLNLLGISGEFVKDFEKERLIQVCRAFIDLIEGKIGYLASEGGPMPGSTKIT